MLRRRRLSALHIIQAVLTKKQNLRGLLVPHSRSDERNRLPTPPSRALLPLIRGMTIHLPACVKAFPAVHEFLYSHWPARSKRLRLEMHMPLRVSPGQNNSALSAAQGLSQPDRPPWKKSGRKRNQKCYNNRSGQGGIESIGFYLMPQHSQLEGRSCKRRLLSSSTTELRRTSAADSPEGNITGAA